MQKRKLGSSGPEVSLVGLGTNNFGGRIDLAASRLVVDKALDLGVTLIDTADVYGLIRNPVDEFAVIPAKAGIDIHGRSRKCTAEIMGPRFRGDDE